MQSHAGVCVSNYDGAWLSLLNPQSNGPVWHSVFHLCECTHSVLSELREVTHKGGGQPTHWQVCSLYYLRTVQSQSWRWRLPSPSWLISLFAVRTKFYSAEVLWEQAVVASEGGWECRFFTHPAPINHGLNSCQPSVHWAGGWQWSLLVGPGFGFSGPGSHQS